MAQRQILRCQWEDGLHRQSLPRCRLWRRILRKGPYLRRHLKRNRRGHLSSQIAPKQQRLPSHIALANRQKPLQAARTRFKAWFKDDQAQETLYAHGHQLRKLAKQCHYGKQQAKTMKERHFQGIYHSYKNLIFTDFNNYKHKPHFIHFNIISHIAEFPISFKLSESDCPLCIKLGNQYAISPGFYSSSHARPSWIRVLIALMNLSLSAYWGILPEIDEWVTHPPFWSANFNTPMWSALSSAATLQITRLFPVSIILKSLPSFWILSTAFLMSSIDTSSVFLFALTACRSVRHSCSSRNPPFFFLSAMHILTIWIYKRNKGLVSEL